MVKSKTIQFHFPFMSRSGAPFRALVGRFIVLRTVIQKPNILRSGDVIEPNLSMPWQHRLPELAVRLKDFALADYNGAAEPKE
jgi:hypothetical protein